MRSILVRYSKAGRLGFWKIRLTRSVRRVWGGERKGRRGGGGGGRRRVHQSCDWNCWRVWKIRWVLFNMHRAFGNFWLSCWLFFLWERRVVEFWCLASRSWINRWLTLVVGLQCARRRCLLVRMAAWMLLPLLRCRDARQESLDVTRWRRAIISILIGTECLSTTISTLRKFPLSFSFSLSLSLFFALSHFNTRLTMNFRLTVVAGWPSCGRRRWRWTLRRRSPRTRRLRRRRFTRWKSVRGTCRPSSPKSRRASRSPQVSPPPYSTRFLATNNNH